MKNYIKICMLTIAMSWNLTARAADPDTLNTSSLPIVVRSFDQKMVDQLKESSDYQYVVQQKERQSFWSKLQKLISKYLEWTFGNIFQNVPSISRWVFITIIAGVAIFALVKLLDINLKDTLFSKSDSGNLKFEVEEENIHELDFSQLIEAAASKLEYRMAIRYLYLFSLKKLSDRQMIEWIPGKTNHDYEIELKGKPVVRHFSMLGYYFEYAWYGEFDVNTESFEKARSIFRRLDEDVK